MVTAEDKQAFTDLSIIIEMMPEQMRRQIDVKFINLIQQNKDLNYVSLIQKDIPIKYQELSETTEVLLALIYREYLKDKK